MPTVKDAEKIIVRVLDLPDSRVGQLVRRLIDNGLLPKSAGRHVKEVTGADIARILFAVAHAGSVADAQRIAQEFATLPYARTSTLGGADAEAPAEFDTDLSLADVIGQHLSAESGTRCDIGLIRGVDDRCRAEITVESPSREAVTHHYYHAKPSNNAGWGFRVDFDAFDELRAEFARA